MSNQPAGNERTCMETTDVMSSASDVEQPDQPFLSGARRIVATSLLAVGLMSIGVVAAVSAASPAPSASAPAASGSPSTGTGGSGGSGGSGSQADCPNM